MPVRALDPLQYEPYGRWWRRRQRTIEALCLELDENGRMAVGAGRTYIGEYGYSRGWACNRLNDEYPE